MVFVLIALWTIAAILLIVNPKRESTKWAALTAFAGGGGGLSRAVTETILPYLHKHEISNAALDAFLFKLHIAGSFMNHNGLPYCFLMYAICYSGFFGKKARRLMAYILPLPIIVMFFITPMSPDVQHNFKILFIWCVPYLLLGLGLLIYSFLKEKNPLMRKSRMFSNLVAIPPIIFQIYANYTLKAFFQVNEIWRYMPLVITVLFVSFLIFGTKYGVLGVRLKFERQRLDSTMRAMTSGTSIINHTIKNEIGKIHMLADRIKYNAVANVQREINKDIDIVMDSTEHMLAMVTRIQSQMQDVALQGNPHNLVKLIENALISIQPYLEQKHILVTKNCTLSVELLCDKVHMQEVFNNILMNAIEAMNAKGGELYIQMYDTKKNIIVEVRDNGEGISKENMPYVIDPFFSTKNNNQNFGLGLSYCYNVMQKHGGSLEVHSEKNVGTTILLHFPKGKATHIVNAPHHEEVVYGQNQSFTG